MSRHVFISYASPDEGFVTNRLMPVLRSAGVRPWEMGSSIPGGAAWEREIRKGIDTASAVIVVVSRAGARSEWVKTEVVLASNVGKTIVPVRIDKTPPQDIYAPLIRLQHIDAKLMEGDWTSRLVDAVQGGGTTSSGHVEGATPSRRGWVVGVTAAAVIAGVLLLILGNGASESEPPASSTPGGEQDTRDPASEPGERSYALPEGATVVRDADPAERYLRQGQWDVAEAVYAREHAKEPTALRPFRGLAEVRLRIAVNLAQRARLTEAITAVDAVVDWLETISQHLDSRPADDPDLRQVRGYTSMFLGECCVQRMKWGGILGDETTVADDSAKAASHFDRAMQYLQRDGVHYWDLLLRRSEMHRLNGDYDAYLRDVSSTTRTNNLEVPTRAWIAHATGCRRITEEALRRDGRQDVARGWAARSTKVIQDAVAWRHSEFTRRDWLEATRVLWVASRVLLEDADKNRGLLLYYVAQMKKLSALAYEPEEKTHAEDLVAEAAALLAGGRPREALDLAEKAARLREGLESEGGEAADPWTFEVLAAIEFKLTYEDRAKKSLARAQVARSRHPE